MEFLRFGSSLPGSYWGCCACDIIQNFKVDPDDKACIQLVDGDGGNNLGKFAGPTYRDIFNQRIRFGTFGTQDMPNHAFIAILTEWQINGDLGKKWLAILRETGFEFIRTVNNSVYSGASLGSPEAEVNDNDNHIFALIRNIGNNALSDPFTPPKAWTDLEGGKRGWEDVAADDSLSYAELTKEQHAFDTEIWNRLGPAKLLTEAEAEALAPGALWYAGVRNKFPQQLKSTRLTAQGLPPAGAKAVPLSPFGVALSQNG